jgi:hypothetical protein
VNEAERIESITAAVRKRIGELVDWSDSREAVIGIQVGVFVCEYIRHYHATDFERFECHDVEIELVHDVVNPATGFPSTLWDHASKFDARVFDRWNEREMIVEHKTTSDDLATFSPYWRKLRIDSQVSKYLLSEAQDGRPEIRECLYDVVKKPTTKPKRVIAKDVKATAESGSYCGFPIRPETLADLREVYEAGKGKKGGFVGKFDESLELYGLRLRSLVMAEPTEFFQRRTIVRTDEELDLYARELWQLAKEKREARKADVAPMNTTNCGAFGRLCEFFALCTGEVDQDSDRFVRPDWVHSELESDEVRKAKKGGRDLLTNSRLTTFQSCRKREFLRYEVGLREAGKTTSVALQWGTLFHKLMELVWSSYGLQTWGENQ